RALRAFHDRRLPGAEAGEHGPAPRLRQHLLLQHVRMKIDDGGHQRLHLLHPSSEGGGWPSAGRPGGGLFNASSISVSTPSRFSSTSLFQNRKTLNPCWVK